MYLSRKFIFRSKTLFQFLISKMSTSNSEDVLLKTARNLVPSLSDVKHKGQDGRIGIVGGSLEYSGAPYFAAMSALRTGADLVHIFCCLEASIPIKSYSPELIVHPVLNDKQALHFIQPWLERLHVILIGPGLGRDEGVFQTVTKLIEICREMSKPLVIDADGLFLISQNPQLIKNYPKLTLTPNAMEFTRLVKAFQNKTVSPQSVIEDLNIKSLAEAIGENVIILHKGATDSIADGQSNSSVIQCSSAGSGRRCGGQGDLLAGALSTFTCWSLGKQKESSMVACYAGCRLVRECNASAFKRKGRGMLASDMLEEIVPNFSSIFELHK